MSSAGSSGQRRRVVGVDIGGANLKSVWVDRETDEVVAIESSFPMWERPETLAEQLVSDWRKLLAEQTRPVDAIAVTMTGELADCFTDRHHGVNHIVDQTMVATGQIGVQDVGFYSTTGRFVSADESPEHIDSLAASNWHALATWVGRSVMPDGILIDIGSTTSDIIAIRDGKVLTESKTDHQRLADQSLVYVGCRRTPVSALVDRVPFRGREIAVMKEFFASIDDARLVLGTQAESPDDNDTADGRPGDIESARRRLAKMIGLDRNEMTIPEVTALASHIIAAATRPIEAGIQFWHDRLKQTGAIEPKWCLSGHGQDLVVHECISGPTQRRKKTSDEIESVGRFGASHGSEVLARGTVARAKTANRKGANQGASVDQPNEAMDLRSLLGSEVSRCAPSFAVAHLMPQHRQEGISP